jgi:hypothetical protein
VHSLQGQPNLTVIALFPLLVYLVVRWWDGALRNTWFVVSMAAAMAVEFYTFDEAFVDMTLVLAGSLLISYSNGIGRYSIDDYVGLPLLAVLLAMAILAWSNKLTRLIVIAFAFVIGLALGPNVVVGHENIFPLPWGGLWSLPLARSAEPSRLIIFAYLLLALALALWLAAPGKMPCRFRSRCSAARLLPGCAASRNTSGRRGSVLSSSSEPGPSRG